MQGGVARAFLTFGAEQCPEGHARRLRPELESRMLIECPQR
jgi:hypothetical protein